MPLRVFTDRDLLFLEPSLFRDAPFPSQRLYDGVGTITGTKLTVTTNGPDLAQVGITRGHVVLFAQTPLEVLERTSSGTLTVSRLRARATDDAIPPQPGTNQTVTVFTFAPQIDAARDEVLDLFGLGPPDDPAIIPTAPLRILEATLAIFFIYSAALAILPVDSKLLGRAAAYRAAVLERRRSVVVHLDRDGDGLPDAYRTAGTGRLMRG